MDYKNNPYLRNFYFSSATFSEYKVTLDIRYIDTIEDIIQDCKENLLNTLKEHNFVQLIDTCNECKFHIHTHTLDEILTAPPDDKIYICDGHC